MREVIFDDNSQLQKIGIGAFSETALEAFTAPASLRQICQQAFFKCAGLMNVKLNEGLEVLGSDDQSETNSPYGGVFENSGIRSVTLPSTLKTIKGSAFKACKNLNTITLPPSTENIDAACF